MFKYIFSIILLLSSISLAENSYQDSKVNNKDINVYNIDFDNEAEVIKLSKSIKEMKKLYLNSSQYNIARNIMLLKIIVNYKMNDKKLKKYFEILQNNKIFNKKVRKFIKKVKNNLYNNSYNKEIIRILNSAGLMLYNNLNN